MLRRLKWRTLALPVSVARVFNLPINGEAALGKPISPWLFFWQAAQAAQAAAPRQGLGGSAPAG
jgi:hypothetical protein